MSIATFKEMVNDVAQFIEDSSPRTVGLIRKRLNGHYSDMAQKRRWDDLIGFINEGLTFTAGNTYLALPEDCAQVLQITDRSKDWTLIRRDLGQMVEDHISTIDKTGGPVIYYSVLGHRATLAPLVEDTRLTVISDSVTDASVGVEIAGLRATPEIRDKETITTTISGEPPEPISTTGTTIWREGWSIMSLSAGSGLTSFITVGTEEDGDTGALAVLTRHNSSSSRYLIVQLQNDPDNTDNLTVVYKKKVSPLVSDDDTPMIPVSEALVESTIATMRRYDEQYTQAREHDRESNKFLSSLVAEEDGQAVKRSQARPAAGRMRNRARMRGF